VTEHVGRGALIDPAEGDADGAERPDPSHPQAST